MFDRFSDASNYKFMQGSIYMQDNPGTVVLLGITPDNLWSVDFMRNGKDTVEN